MNKPLIAALCAVCFLSGEVDARGGRGFGRIFSRPRIVRSVPKAPKPKAPAVKKAAPASPARPASNDNESGGIVSDIVGGAVGGVAGAAVGAAIMGGGEEDQATKNPQPETEVKK